MALKGTRMRFEGSSKLKVAVLDDYSGKAQDLAPWETLGSVSQPHFFQEHIRDEVQLTETLEPFNVISLMRERTHFPATVIGALPNLRLLVTSGMQNAAIDMSAATARRILVCGTNSHFHDAAELAWALILALVRNVPREDLSTRQGRWQTTMGVALRGKHLGVLGLGTIGTQVARIGQAFGMTVLAWSENLTTERGANVGVQVVPKDVLLETSDVVSIHLRLSERTLGLIGGRELRLMKPTAFIVNTSRGPIVDEEALLEALRGGHIAGAGLDVFDVEPLPENHPLLTLENTVITPHLGYVTDENMRLFYRETVEDIAAFQTGRPVRVLNPAARDT